MRKCRSVDGRGAEGFLPKKNLQRLASQDRRSAYFPLVEVPASKEKLKNQRIFSKALQFRVCRFFFHRDIGTRHQCCRWRRANIWHHHIRVWRHCTVILYKKIGQDGKPKIRHCNINNSISKFANMIVFAVPSCLVYNSLNHLIP